MQMWRLAVSMLWCSICRRSNRGDGGIGVTPQMQRQIQFLKNRRATIAVRMVGRECDSESSSENVLEFQCCSESGLFTLRAL